MSTWRFSRSSACVTACRAAYFGWASLRCRRRGCLASSQMNGWQPDNQRAKAGDVQDNQPDRDGEQVGIDLAGRPVEPTHQPAWPMMTSRRYRLYCHFWVSLPFRPFASGRLRNRLGEHLQLADGLPTEQHRDEGADRHDHQVATCRWQEQPSWRMPSYSAGAMEQPAAASSPPHFRADSFAGPTPEIP